MVWNVGDEVKKVESWDLVEEIVLVSDLDASIKERLGVVDVVVVVVLNAVHIPVVDVTKLYTFVTDVQAKLLDHLSLIRLSSLA